MITFSTTCGFGPTKTGLLPTISAELCRFSGTVVATVTGVGGGIRHVANGEYVAEITAPDGFADGYVRWDPGDGSRIKTLGINLAGSTISVNLGDVGAYRLAITVQDDADTPQPVPDVGLTVRTLAGTVKAYGTTDVDGEAAFHLNPDTYQLLTTSRVGYDTPAPQEVTITTSDVTLVVTLPLRAPVGLPAGLCEVRFLILKNGQPVEGAALRAELLKSNSTTQQAGLLSLQVDEAETGPDGTGSLFLVQQGQFVTGNGVYRITVADVSGATEKVMSSKETKIPNVSAVDYANLVQGAG